MQARMFVYGQMAAPAAAQRRNADGAEGRTGAGLTFSAVGVAASRPPSDRSQSTARILVGTSGWSYPSWRGPFFPTLLAAKRHLEYYASQFETAELNGVFYRTPTPAAVEGWRDQTGPSFVFAWKASKFITHWRRLSQNSVNSLQLLEERLSILGDKAGPVLFQLPRQFEADAGRLAEFLTLLPEGRRYSFEFRHPTSYAPEILNLLADRNIALCIFGSP